MATELPRSRVSRPDNIRAEAHPLMSERVEAPTLDDSMIRQIRHDANHQFAATVFPPPPMMIFIDTIPYQVIVKSSIPI